MNQIDLIKKYGNKGVKKVIPNINLKLFNNKFENIYNIYVNMVKEYIKTSKYDILITKISYNGMKRLFKNIILEYIRNNENIMYKYIKTKYPKIKFHCIDTYNFYNIKKKKKHYVFCYEDKKIVTYKLTKNNYTKINKKVPFEYKISNQEHSKGCDNSRKNNILTFVDNLYYPGSSSKYTTLYNTCISNTFEQLLNLTKDNNINHIFLSQYNIQEIGHANAIIIDNPMKKIIRLEPLVKEPINNIGVLINKLVNATNYKYISVCNTTTIAKGLQKTSQTGDWCTIWAYYMSLLYYQNYNDSTKLFKFLVGLEEYNTNFMFYYIFDIFYKNEIFTQELINKLFDKVLNAFKEIKHFENEEFITVIQYLTDYSMFPQIVRIFDEKEDKNAIKIFIKNIHENFDKESNLIIKKIFKKN
jgi:hypothetical protein